MLSVGAEPYIGVTSLFETVIVPNLAAGANTTSSTAVTAATAPTLASLTLASGTGFSAGDRIVVDVDGAQEVATARSVSGATLTLFLQKAHAGTYPVTVEGPESIIRELLTRIREAKQRLGDEFGLGLLKRADDIEWYSAGGKSGFEAIDATLSYWREQLASALGVETWWKRQQAAGSRMAVY